MVINIISKFLKQNTIYLFCIFILFYCKKPEVTSDNVWNVGIHSEPSKIDPIFSIDLSSQKLNHLLFRKLFKNNNDSNSFFDLANSVSWKENGKLYIKISKALSSNGLELNSEDIKFSLERLITEPGPRKSIYSAIISKVHIISDQEVFIEYKSSKSKLIEILSMPTSSIYKKEPFIHSNKFISFGIYSITHWDKNQNIVLELNKNHPDKDKYPSKINLTSISESSNAIFLFSKNKLDIMKLPYFFSNHPVSSKGKIIKTKSKSVQYIAINHKNPCYDLSFRKALNYAVDKKKIIDKVFEQEAVETFGPIPIGFSDEIPLKSDSYKYDPNLAKKFLSKSKCYPQILDRKIELRMKADDENKAKGLVLSKYFSDIGLKIKVKPMEKVNLYKENSFGLGDLTLLTWFIDYDSINNFIHPLFDSNSMGNAGNRSFYKNNLIDTYITKIQTDTDLKPSVNLKNETMEVLNTLIKDAPWVFLWSLNENYILSNKISDIEIAKNFLF